MGNKPTTVLAGDIGASKTILALYSLPQSFNSPPLKEKTYQSADSDSIIPILDDFLADFAGSIDAAAFGIAGPVRGQKAKITKLTWSVDVAEIQAHLHISKVFLINDLVANVYGLSCLDADDFISLNEVAGGVNSPKAMISPGTGLGEAFFIEQDGSKQVFPSEGGNCNFAPVNEVQVQLLNYLQKSGKSLLLNDLCCGDGFFTIYDFLKMRASVAPNKEVEALVAKSEIPAAVITDHALNKSCALCAETVKLFVQILANETANMVLKLLATGGVYIGGGIPPKILPVLKEHFMDAFGAHPTMSHILAQTPVRVVCNAKAALYGAVAYAVEQLD